MSDADDPMERARALGALFGPRGHDDPRNANMDPMAAFFWMMGEEMPEGLADTEGADDGE